MRIEQRACRQNNEVASRPLGTPVMQIVDRRRGVRVHIDVLRHGLEQQRDAVVRIKMRQPVLDGELRVVRAQIANSVRAAHAPAPRGHARACGRGMKPRVRKSLL